MRQNLISYGKIYSKYPKDPRIRGSYYKKYRLYNKCRKIKYKQFMNSMLDKLDNLPVDNPKQYWKLINDIRDVQRDDSTSHIDAEIWVEHFRNLHSKSDSNFQTRLKELEVILKDKRKIHSFQ